jgi:hypothetical protein
MLKKKKEISKSTIVLKVCYDVSPIWGRGLWISVRVRVRVKTNGTKNSKKP